MRGLRPRPRRLACSAKHAVPSFPSRPLPPSPPPPSRWCHRRSCQRRSRLSPRTPLSLSMVQPRHLRPAVTRISPERASGADSLILVQGLHHSERDQGALHRDHGGHRADHARHHHRRASWSPRDLACSRSSAAIIYGFVALLFSRVFLELIMVFFNIHEYTKKIAGKSKVAPGGSSLPRM